MGRRMSSTTILGFILCQLFQQGFILFLFLLLVCSKRNEWRLVPPGWQGHGPGTYYGVINQATLIRGTMLQGQFL